MAIESNQVLGEYPTPKTYPQLSSQPPQPKGRRSGQKDIRSQAVRLRLTGFYDPTTNSFYIADSTGHKFLIANLSTGIFTINTEMLFPTQKNGSNQLVVQDSTGTVKGKIFVSSGGFVHFMSNSYDFQSNSGNFFEEIFGPTAHTADTGGVHAFRVVDNNGLERFALRSNGQLEIQGNTSGAAAKTDAANLYVDNGGSGGKHRLMCQFQTGSAQVVATEP